MPTHSCEVTFWRSIPNASLASQGDCRFYRNIPQYKTSKSASKSCKETVAAIYLSSNNHKSNLINQQDLDAAQDATLPWLPWSTSKLDATSELSHALGTGGMPSDGRLHQGLSHVTVQVQPALG